MRDAYEYLPCAVLSKLSEGKEMARPSPYDAKTRQAIIDAAVGARSGGKKWSDAYEAAKGEGYKGGLQYLMKMIRGSGASGGGKRGRRRGRKPGPRPGARATTGSGLGSIEAIVNRMVEARLQSSVRKAVAALERAAAELRKL
jgi:hypothetical protein